MQNAASSVRRHNMMEMIHTSRGDDSMGKLKIEYEDFKRRSLQMIREREERINELEGSTPGGGGSGGLKYVRNSMDILF